MYPNVLQDSIASNVSNPVQEFPTGHNPYVNNYLPQQHHTDENFGAQQFQEYACTSHANPIEVSLKNENEWQSFSEEVNEMMCLNAGRDIFPRLELEFRGLHPAASYKLGLKLDRQSSHVLRYNRDAKKNSLGWVNSNISSDDCEKTTNELISAVKPGSYWMMSHKHFEGTKIYNVGKDYRTKQKPREEMTEKELQNVLAYEKKQISTMLKVNTHQRYVPVVTVYGVLHDGTVNPLTTVSFPETSFIVVTSYKNEKIRLMKTKNNKFCRGDIKKKITKKPAESESLKGPKTADTHKPCTSNSSTYYVTEPPPNPTPNFSQNLYHHHNAVHLYQPYFPTFTPFSYFSSNPYEFPQYPMPFPGPMWNSQLPLQALQPIALQNNRQFSPHVIPTPPSNESTPAETVSPVDVNLPSVKSDVSEN